MTDISTVMLVWKGNYYSLKSMLCCLNPDCEKPINQDTDKSCQSCGTELIPRLRNRFTILKPLGRGGFGKTYLAEDTDKLKEKCVVKQLIYQAQGSHKNQLILDLFMREAEQLQQLWANPQIPSLFAYFEEGGYLYLVQQYVEGQDLLKELKADGCFNDQKIQTLLQDLLPVFEAIHQRKVIHRDIKPENIMRRGSDGKLILIDFGVSKQLSKSIMSVAGTMVGSLGYAAPEQMESGIAHANSDLYSLGASCFHLMTGINPWSLWKMQGYGWLSEWRKHLQQPISEELGKVLDKLLQIEPADRYQTANEVLTDLAKNPGPNENLRQYEEQLSQAVQSAYPLDDDVRDGLKQLQQSLGLLDADVARIEQPILKQAEAERQERIKQQAEAKRQERLRQKAEANRQEQLRQQLKAQRKTEAQRQASKQNNSIPNSQQPPSTYPSVTPSPIHPSSTQKNQSPFTRNRRQFLNLAGLCLGVGGVLTWQYLRKSFVISVRSPIITQPSGEQLGSFDFETVQVSSRGEVIERLQKQVQFIVEDLGGGTTLELVEIPEGTFTMGSSTIEFERDRDEGPQHEVTLSAFYLGKYLVTQAQWEAIMGFNPSRSKGARRPVERVSWKEAVEFCQKLSQKSGKDYRLPSEAEWEYACRAGTTTPFYFGETITTGLANYRGTDVDYEGRTYPGADAVYKKTTYPGYYASGPKGEFREQTTDVGNFPPNTFGLYDMHGNVWEWCQDTSHDNYEGAPADGSAWIDEDNNYSRIIRGGSWDVIPRSCRSSERFKSHPSHSFGVLGFRVALFAPSTR